MKAEIADPLFLLNGHAVATGEGAGMGKDMQRCGSTMLPGMRVQWRGACRPWGRSAVGGA